MGDRKIKVRTRLSGEDVVYIDRDRFFRWEYGAGCYSANCNKIEVKLNEVAEKFEDLLYELQQANLTRAAEVREAKQHIHVNKGCSETHHMDLKEFKKYEGGPEKPDTYWMDCANHQLLRKYGLDEDAKKRNAKKKGKTPVADIGSLTGGEGSIYVTPGTSEDQRERMSEEGGGVHVEVVHPKKDKPVNESKKERKARLNKENGERNQ